MAADGVAEVEELRYRAVTRSSGSGRREDRRKVAVGRKCGRRKDVSEENEGGSVHHRIIVGIIADHFCVGLPIYLECITDIIDGMRNTNWRWSTAVAIRLARGKRGYYGRTAIFINVLVSGGEEEVSRCELCNGVECCNDVHLGARCVVAVDWQATCRR